jgi:hypothetical protein
MSADGSKLAVAGGSLYTSEDFGNTWVTNFDAPSGALSLACSADGCTWASAVRTNVLNPADIWVGRVIPTPQLNLTPTNGSLAFSWTLASTNFVLQGNPDLTASNWTTISNAPVLNLTNLQEEVALQPSNSSGFYRLISQ